MPKRQAVPSAAHRAVAYLRVSTEEQAKHGVSLAAQEERIRAYRLLAGLELTALLREEGVSGSTPLGQRPAGARLLEQVSQVQHVVALKLDRLFRDAEDALRQTRAWDRAAVALHLVDLGGQSMNTGSAMGRMLLTMMAGFAEFERNLIAERTAAALSHKKAHRQVYNHVPYGFAKDGSRLVPFEAEQTVIRRIQACSAAGWTLRRIADALNTDGIPTKQGSQWFAQTVKNVLDSTMHQAA